MLLFVMQPAMSHAGGPCSHAMPLSACNHMQPAMTHACMVHARPAADLNDGQWHMITLSTFGNGTRGYALFVDGQ